ncbi:NAD(P)/FAD-dependent oxidoreductase [Micromonospora sp. WMMD1102]|uniref:FAD-dependent oxidoreductase n=1 Tax=Micromonospora sp. WMMD1102 TaxID=3016105 RepID=UPI0024154353|nr:NAD(P)/FAD-dependent oxidoreductase [Micromonospora sp. WMMD1102]MDG4788447.1 NAD(P)/FAD-dependent oxidoreductase [Micromonospora sp. WMMD1102]
MRVVIAGGGIGGLACAQGLVRAGLDVTVVEPDRELGATGGYKLHLAPPAVRALRALLPPVAFEDLLGASVATRGFALILRDHRGRRLLRAADRSDDLALDVDRITLREVLARGLGDHLLLGRSCTGWRAEDDHVTAVLDDGATIRADVLVIADGAGSHLAEQLAGHPTSYPCGLVGVAGRTRWPDVPAAARALLADEPMLAVGPGGTGLFATEHDPAGRSALRAARFSAATTEPVAIWGLLALEEALPERPSGLDAGQLRARATELLARHRWAGPLVGLLENAELSSVGAFRLNASDPDRLAPWRASRVTALGDAVHAMPPTGGQGAATAVLDARDLVAALSGAARGDATTVVAVHDYESRLRVRAAGPVRESLRPVRWIRAAATPAGRLAVRAGTPLLATAARLLTGWRR